jgi:RimJ/RimL family protein N-acetyltransferase
MADIRLLTKDDADAYRTILLRALKDHPEAFGLVYEEVIEMPSESLGEWLVGGRWLGAFDNDELVGIVHLDDWGGSKARHQGIVGTMYVAPEARGKRIGRALLDVLMDRAQSQGFEDLVLGVTVGNEAARTLYANSGFQKVGIIPRWLKVDGRYYDVEWMWMSLESRKQA